MTVSRDSDLRSEWEGTTYYFCGPGCKARFDADPARYVDPERVPEHAHQH
jgi:Cu+-exporting ATPase